MRVVLAAREEDGGGCDGDGVLRLTRVIIVCCRHCASLLWHPVVYNVHVSGTALALIKYSFTFTQLLFTSDWLYLSIPYDKGVVAIQSSKTTDERS